MKMHSLRHLKTTCILSVIIPVYNTDDYLEECLSSVIAATEKKGIPSEILIVDDHCTDKSIEIARRFAEEHSIIRILSSEDVTRGPGHARNIALDQATGEYIAFVDSDDIVADDIYEDMLASLYYFRSDICVCDVARLKNGRQTVSVPQNRAFSHITFPVTTLSESPSLVFGLLLCNTVVRRSLLLDNNIRNPENTFYEDFLICLKIASVAKRITFIRNAKYLWRIRGAASTSITQSYDENQNFLDRTEMNRKVIHYALDASLSPEIVQTLLKKILILYPATMLDTADMLPDDVLSERVRIMKEFAREFIPEHAFQTVPIITEQLWNDIQEENLKAIRRCVNYRKVNYFRVPVVCSGSDYEIVPNTSIITVARRNIRHDFAFAIPVCHVRSAVLGDDSLRLSGLLYFKRISVPEVGTQHIHASLYNDITGETTSLDTADVPALESSAARNIVFNYDDYTSYPYDYRGGGFSIDMNLRHLMRHLAPGNYLIMMDYEHPLKKGTRILRGIHPRAIKALSDISLEDETRKLQVSVDKRQTLQLKITIK